MSLPDLLLIFSSGHFFLIRGETVRRKCMTYFAQVIANLEKALEEKQKLEVNIVLMLLCFKIIKSSFLIIKGEVEGLCGQRPGRDGTNGEGDQGSIGGN